MPFLRFQKLFKYLSFRYGQDQQDDARSRLIRLAAFLQGKKVVLLNSQPELCAQVLAASDKKGDFLERLIATPAWHPIYSIESMDDDHWKQLSDDFKKLMNQLQWRERLTPLIHQTLQLLLKNNHTESPVILDSETLCKLVVATLYELLFNHSMSAQDQNLFYTASVEWRKEIAVKGKANPQIKSEFWKRLHQIVSESSFKEGLLSYQQDPSNWLSLFAQPFLISPQINISDIFVTVFGFLKSDPTLYQKAKIWAVEQDKARLSGILLEAIRLQHPFPILERELKQPLSSPHGHFTAGTQFFILLDQFKQDQRFDPERWLLPQDQNPYHALPFAAGPRMCIGKPIALELMVQLLQSFLIEFDLNQIQPQQGHLYSGRDNDQSSGFKETLYQLRVFSKVLLKSFFLRFKK
jgi:hypothetical protein